MWKMKGKGRNPCRVVQGNMVHQPQYKAALGRCRRMVDWPFKRLVGAFKRVCAARAGGREVST